MTIVEIYESGNLIWGGTMWAVPVVGSIIVLTIPATESQVESENKVYRVMGCVWGIVAGYTIAEQRPQIQVIEVDPATMQPRKSLIQTPNLTIN